MALYGFLPVIANIYMHYVLLWWFKERFAPKAKGYCGIVVYADDFVVCFQYKADAEKFYEALKRRMGHFGLSLEEEKSRLLEFGRFAARDRYAVGKGKPECQLVFHLHDRMILCFPLHANTEFHRDSEDFSYRNLYGLIRGFSL